MTHRTPAWIAVAAICALAGTSRCAVAESDADAAPTLTSVTSPVADPLVGADGLEHLVPELANNAYRLQPGERPYEHRLSVTPGYGKLGSERLFALRVAYNPNTWLGYEASIEHNPGEAVHAVLHTLNVVLRHPFPGRFQPYVTGGYGMITVHPGRSLNADPVSKNLLSYGGGIEVYIRSDLAIRGDMQRATVFGRERDRDGVVVYDYLQQTIGLCFYRSIAP